MQKKTIYIEGPATVTEYTDNASLRYEATLTVEHEIQCPNPNLDAYLSMEYISETIGKVDFENKVVEFDWRNVDVYLDLTSDDLIESAEWRAAEDCTDRGSVLEDWKRRLTAGDKNNIHGSRLV